MVNISSCNILCVFADTRNLPVSSNFVTILVSSVGAVSWLLFLQKKHFKILPKAVYYVYIPIGFILLSQIINMDTSLAYESKISQLLLGYVIVSSVSFKSFFDHYLRIMTVVAIVSTVVWVTTFLGITWWSFLPTTWENNYYSYLIGVIHTNPLLQHRNFGPFGNRVFIKYTLILLFYICCFSEWRNEVFFDVVDSCPCYYFFYYRIYLFFNNPMCIVMERICCSK